MTGEPGGGALRGLRVLDLARYRPGVLLGAMLADHGADVVALGTEVRTDLGWAERGRSRLALEPDGVAGRSAVQALAERADVVLDEATWEVPVPASVVRVRLPARAGAHGEPVWEGPISAFAGLYETPLRRAPAYTPLAVTSLITALYAMIGVLAALRARGRDGRGQTVEVPALDAALAASELTALLTDDGPTRWSPVRWAASPFLRAWRCADGGWVYVHAGMPGHARRLIEVLGRETPGFPELRLSEATLRDPSHVASIAEARRVLLAFTRAFSTHAAQTWEDTLSAEGLCAARVRTAEEWLDHPHPRAAGHVVGDGDARAPGVPIVLSATPGHASSSGMASSAADLWPGASPWSRPLSAVADLTAPLHDVTVLDATQVIAGPTAARTLAELGARVLRVENPRLLAGWVEPFHIAFNAGKQSALLDLASDAGRASLREVVLRERPDVLIESFRPGKASRLGLDVAREARPDAVVTSITAYGPGGPWEGRPGWEQTAQAAAGLQADRGGDGAPRLVPLPICDFTTGLSGAVGTLLALLHRDRGGGGQDVAVSLAGSAVWVQAPYACRPAPSGRPSGEVARGWGPLRRFVSCADGDAFWEGRPDPLRGVEGLDGVDVADPAAVDRALRRASVAVWQARLAGRDISLWPRRTLSQALGDPQARARRLIRREPWSGTRGVTLVGPPLSLSGTPLVPLSPVPRGAQRWVGDPARRDLPAPRDPSRLSWLVEQARWALFLRTGW